MVCGVGAALYLLVAVVEGLRGESLMTDNLTSERRFLPSMISTGSYVELQVRKKVGSAQGGREPLEVKNRNKTNMRSS